MRKLMLWYIKNEHVFMIFQKAKQDIYFGAKEGEFLISNFLNVYCSKKKFLLTTNILSYYI